MIHWLFCCIMSMMIHGLYALSHKEAFDLQIKEGNLLLPISQRPIAFFNFGQLIADKNDFLFFGSLTARTGKQQKYIDSLQQFLYAPIDDVAILLSTNQALQYKVRGNDSSGFADTVVEVEYNFAKQYKPTSTKRATIVGMLQLPTGSARQYPPTGLGSPAIFLGLVGYHTSIEWYHYLEAGVLLTTPHHHSKAGNQIWYGAGIGHNLHHFQRWILALIIESNGMYSRRDCMKGTRNQNSGSNILYIGPTFFAADKRFIFKVSVQIPAYQKINGAQPKINVLFGARLGIKFTNVM